MTLLGLPALAVLLVLTPLLVVRRQRVVADRLTHPALHRMSELQDFARWGGIAAGALLVVVAQFRNAGHGLGLVLAPLVFALGILIGLMGGEMWVWRLARTPGVAALEERRASGFLPRRGLAVLAVSLVSLVALLGWALTRQDDDPTSDTFHRGYAWTGPDGSHNVESPFPGQFYSVPVVVLTGLVLVVLVIGVVVALRRPRNGADPVVVEVDNSARRGVIEQMVAATSLGVAGTLGLCAAMAFLPTLHQEKLLAWVWLAVMLLEMATCSFALSVILVPGRRKQAS